jgi:hypothetical protein
MLLRRQEMNNKRGIWIIISLLALSLIASIGCTQKSVQVQGSASAIPEGPTFTVKGKIDYWKNINDYVIIGEEPPRTYYIVNQDPKIMEELSKSKKTIIIEGRRTMGADNIFIEKINGQTYRGKE